MPNGMQILKDNLPHQTTKLEATSSVQCKGINSEPSHPQMEFWYRYKNLNPCHTNLCLNGGICTQDREDFLCLCPPGFHGKTCNSEVLECRNRNGGCLQYCKDLAGGAGVQCGCANGFKLETDGKTCTPTGNKLWIPDPDI
ncbi:hypothetical protein CRENBAI_008502 [Crenichthys baileyi]|uniref:EGF-like domain-containing protein n=1 Tax=Crenichthys baileyi TaxID=28760 RepID=A0AAV9QWI4_9TELE